MTKDDEAAQAAGDALEQALLKATRSVEAELTRILKRGEDNLGRLAGRIAETLARLAVEGVMGVGSGAADPAAVDERQGSEPSLNQIATALVRAARRGGRFL